MESTKYLKVTISNKGEFFALYCTEESLKNRRDEIDTWIDKLAERLHWRAYETSIGSVGRTEAELKPYALFEHRFPVTTRKRG